MPRRDYTTQPGVQQVQPWAWYTTLSEAGKASLDGVNDTGWKPMLHCSPERQAMTGDHEEAIPVDPSRPATA